MYRRRLLVRLGIAALGFSLIVPSALGEVVPAPPHALVASMTGTQVGLADLLIDADIVPAPTTAPSPAPTPRATARPLPEAGGPAVPVTASWYGPGFYGNRLPCWTWLQASGLPVQLRADTWGVAHKTLPCGTMLRLRHGDQEVSVPVVDRGPYIAGRELDLSPRVKAALGCTELCTVLMQIQQDRPPSVRLHSGPSS